MLGAGYVGGALAERALETGVDVLLADNWYATRREQLAKLEERGARVETADIRKREEIDRLLAEGPERVFLLAAQASRPLSEREPDYTEETNVTGARRVAEAVAERGGPMLVYASSLHVYGPGLTGNVDANQPYGPQSDLAHLSKIYAELCLGLNARRGRFDLAVLRLGIVYGPSPVEHERPESQTVVDRFRRLAEAGEELPIDDGGKATIGVVHVEDAARILLESGSGVANVAAETVTVADVARLARGEAPGDEPAFTVRSPFDYRHTVREYLRP
ncbi:MAG TPA: NAD-dependent epimerase/dehydratase family protein [Gaiellaceae bacterium]|nr:NAD-dependent epimerase/dehydratase family protein [Gaiellaceae bacterium]